MIARLQANSISLTTLPTDYWHQSRRPLASLLFVLPLLLFYEGAILWLGPATLRSGADLWMQQLLTWFGFNGFLLLPLLTVAILLAWHHATQKPWRISANVLYTMAIESAIFAAILLGVAHLQAVVLSVANVATCEVPAQAADNHMIDMVRYFGVGIYEEFLFRLILIPSVMTAIGVIAVSRKVKVIGALLVTSLMFSAAHHMGPYGEPLQIYPFIFRFLAGSFFAILFVYRGFGIAAGTHALYDILVGFPA